MPKKTVIATNKKAFHDYFIEERYEAGIVLVGTEVKSLRERKANLRDSFAQFKKSEVYLYNMHISPYVHGKYSNHEPYRARKLLLHKREIRKLVGKIKEKGYALVPLRVYFSGSFAKVELGLGKGKRLYDKRREIAKKTAEREIARELKTVESGRLKEERKK